MKYLVTNFSPLMLDTGVQATIREVSLSEVQEALPDLVLSFGHGSTAAETIILTKLFEHNIPIAVNFTLKKGDEAFCVVPNLRGKAVWELSKQDAEKMVRCFKVIVE